MIMQRFTISVFTEDFINPDETTIRSYGDTMGSNWANESNKGTFPSGMPTSDSHAIINIILEFIYLK